MMIIVVHDIEGSGKAAVKRQRRIASICEAYGVRVQRSVFECEVNADQLRNLVLELNMVLDADTDSVRLYSLGNRWQNRIQVLGHEPVGWDREACVL